MDNQKNDNLKVNIDDIPELDLDILDEIVEETAEAVQPEPAQPETLQSEVSEQEEKIVLPELDMEVIDFIFDEEDKKVQLFDEDDFDADSLSIFDRDKKDLDLNDLNDEDDDLVFIDAISVRDRRRINKIHMDDTPVYDDVNLKTRRRSHDETEVKKERSIAFAKKNIVLIGIGVLVLIVIIGAISVGVRKFKENHSDVPVISNDSDAYQVAVQDDIEKLMTEYFEALAGNDTYVLKEVLSPSYDNELMYNGIYSDYVDAYENVTCYAKEGLEEGDYLVAVYFETKYAKVRDVAPEVRFFYVQTNQDGDLYINNIYGQHNLTYKESEVDPSIENLLSSYQTEAEIASLVGQAQESYDEAIASSNKLKEMVEVTIPTALADWYTSMEDYLSIQDEPVIDEPTTPEDSPEQQPEPQQPADQGVTEASGTVYVTDLINIRQSPSTDSEVLASATFGSELTRLGVTEDGWTKIKTGDIVGYVKSEFVSESKPSATAGSVITLKEILNLRAGKDQNSELVESIPAGESVKVLEPDSNGWTKVDYNGKTGYIRTDLLTGN